MGAGCSASSGRGGAGTGGALAPQDRRDGAVAPDAKGVDHGRGARKTSGSARSRRQSRKNTSGASKFVVDNSWDAPLVYIFKETIQCKFEGGRNCRCEDPARQKVNEITGLHSNWVTPAILAMARPWEAALRDGAAEELRDKGVAMVLNLQEVGEHAGCGPGILAESGFSYLPETLMRVGIQHQNLSWKDMGTPNMGRMMDIVQIMDGVMRAGGKVAVHCHAGLGRTGLAIACCMVYRHDAATAEEAVAMVRRNRPGALQTQAQEAFVDVFEAWLKHLRCHFPVRPSDSGPVPSTARAGGESAALAAPPLRQRSSAATPPERPDDLARRKTLPPVVSSSVAETAGDGDGEVSAQTGTSRKFDGDLARDTSGGELAPMLSMPECGTDVRNVVRETSGRYADVDVAAVPSKSASARRLERKKRAQALMKHQPWTTTLSVGAAPQKAIALAAAYVQAPPVSLWDALHRQRQLIHGEGLRLLYDLPHLVYAVKEELLSQNEGDGGDAGGVLLRAGAAVRAAQPPLVRYVLDAGDANAQWLADARDAVNDGRWSFLRGGPVLGLLSLVEQLFRGFENPVGTPSFVNLLRSNGAADCLLEDESEDDAQQARASSGMQAKVMGLVRNLDAPRARLLAELASLLGELSSTVRDVQAAEGAREKLAAWMAEALFGLGEERDVAEARDVLTYVAGADWAVTRLKERGKAAVGRKRATLRDDMAQLVNVAGYDQKLNVFL
ncbi:unnamed protein product [Pedinophyceae sp. YPF-701]|nr:unnamed protein product [Pedinophyceae sp. YPF-701]